MSFLFPMAWWLGILALPVIGFYLLKTRQRRKPVSTLIFWHQIKPKVENSPFWRRLRRWISLALQLLILALVIGALARPAFDWEKKDAQHIVVILDNSASMQAQRFELSRWLSATERLASMIERLRIQDEVAIITADDPPRLVSGWSSSKQALRNALSRVEVLNVGTDPTAAFGLARELAATRENTRQVVFSDAVWPSTVKVPPEVAINGVDPKPPVNTGLTLFAVRRSPIAPGDWQLDAEITSPVSFSGRVELRRDGQPMDLVTVDCGPGKPWSKTWRGSSETGAELEAVLLAKPDDMLAIDDRARCTLAPLRRLQVVVTGPPDPFLEAVLDSIPLVAWQRANSFPAVTPDETDLIIAGGYSLPDRSGRVPLLLINPARSGFWGDLAGRLSEAPVTDVEKKSILLRYVGLSSVVIGEAGQWTPAPGSEVLASSMGNPLVFGQWDRDPKVMVLGFEPGKSDLPLRTAFPVFMGNLLQSLRGDHDLLKGAATLPGRVESDLQPLAPPSTEGATASFAPVFPGWWLVLLMALIVVVAEWFTYNRRITD